MTGAAAADGMVDLFGLLAYAELVAFLRLAGDAALAPSLEDKAELGQMAVAEFAHFRVLRGELERMGAVPEQAMEPFVEPLDQFHARTAPSDWLESLVKASVGDGIAADFYRAVAELLEPQARALVLEVLADTGHADFATKRVRAAVEADPAVAGRPRPVGEAAGRRGAGPGAPGGRGPAPAGPVARGRGQRAGTGRPGRHRADVRPAHRRPRAADGRSRARACRVGHPALPR